MTLTINGTSTAWINNLQDSTIKSDVEAMVAKGGMTYDSLLGLFADITTEDNAAAPDGKGSVTAGQFADLNLLVNNLNNGLDVPNDLAAALRSVVVGSQANQYYYGGKITRVALGNLEAGTSTTKLNLLVNEWLKGLDNPDSTQPADPDSATGLPTYYSYASFSTASLYGASGTPSYTDVAQGGIGTCVVSSTMIERALVNSSDLQNSIVSLGDGVYSIRFYIGGQEVWETVDSQLPVDANGNLAYAGSSKADGTVGLGNGLWVSLIEKAYAQLSATGATGHTSGVNSYANIDGNYASVVLGAFTGTVANNYDSSNSEQWSYAKQIIIDALKSGEDVEIGTASGINGTTVIVDGKTLTAFVAGHEYAITGYDSVTGNFIVNNPWGYETTASPDYAAQFEASMADLATVGGTVTIDASAKTAVEITYANNSPLDAASGQQSDWSQDVVAQSSVAVSSLFTAVDTAGYAIATYDLQLVGAGALALNGATNLGTEAQAAAGEYIVSAADLAKLTYEAGNTLGGAELLVSATDSAGNVAPTADIALTVSRSPGVALPIFDQVVGANQQISLNNLISLIGSGWGVSSNLLSISIVSGGGSLDISKAANSASWGSYWTVSGADLQAVSYKAGEDSGQVVLSVTPNNGGVLGDAQYFALYVGANTVQALQNYANGLDTSGQAILDTTTDILNNIDGVQTAVSAQNIVAIELSDSDVVDTISGAQLVDDLGALSMIGGAYTVNVTQLSAAELSSNISRIDIFSHLGALTLSSEALTPVVALTDAQVSDDAALLDKIDNAVWGYSTATVTSYSFNASGTTLSIGAGQNLPIFVKSFGASDLIHLAALSGDDSFVVSDKTVTISGGGESIELTFDTAAIAGALSLTYDAADHLDVLTICFMPGTRIATPAGETAIECLRRGDPVLTSEGEIRSVRWIGRQTISRAFADPLRDYPIRVRAGALGENIPVRDLLVSPDHALLVESVLVHAGALVNGATITRETQIPDSFVYYHVELDDQSLILAENTPAETFVDNADRRNFDNWAEHEALYPQGKPIAELSLPRAKARRQLTRRIVALLGERAEALGVALRAAA